MLPTFSKLAMETPHAVGLLALDGVAPSFSFYFRAYCWTGGSHLEGKSRLARVPVETCREEIAAGNCAFSRCTRREFTFVSRGVEV